MYWDERKICTFHKEIKPRAYWDTEAALFPVKLCGVNCCTAKIPERRCKWWSQRSSPTQNTSNNRLLPLNLDRLRCLVLSSQLCPCNGRKSLASNSFIFKYTDQLKKKIQFCLETLNTKLKTIQHFRVGKCITLGETLAFQTAVANGLGSGTILSWL